MTTPIVRTRGQLVSWAGFVFGSLTSIAANVLHTWLPAGHMPPDWTPGIAPQIGAAVWPIGLLLSVEVLSRARWRRGRWWSLARYGGAGTVALGSAVISYSHVRDVLLAWGYGHPAAEFGPLTLDGLMVVSGFALMSMTSRDDTAAAAGLDIETATELADGHTESTFTVTQGVPVPTSVEPPMLPVHPDYEPMTTLSGHGADTEGGQADTPVEDADIGADSRRTRAQELHAQGWTHGRIAVELGVSKRTVRRYVSTTADTESATPATESNQPVEDWLSALDANHHDTNSKGVLV